MAQQIVLFIALVLCVGVSFAQRQKNVAYANLNSGGNGVYGLISFVFINNVTHIRGTIGGLKDGEHGLHIHESGNISNNCRRIGDHYNPYNRTHSCDAATGHLGDLGNVTSTNGVADVNKMVTGMTLTYSNGKEGNGNPGVLSLSIAVDMNPDDCSAINDGNSGPVIGCGRIMSPSK